MLLSRSDIIACERELARRSLTDFVRMAWPVIDTEDYVHGWHMEAVCDHLQAVARGEITRLLINLPPGMSKSSLTSVFFPAWLWGPAGMPHIRFIGASHEQSVATRDNRRTRLLVGSEWFQQRWPIKLTTDQNEKTYFENEHRGFRQSNAVKSITGKRGHVVVWDDPQNPEQANSEVERETAIRILRETLPSRMVDPTRSAIVIIMQRLHEDDVSGYILANDFGYEHLCLPMEFEPDRRCETSIGFTDPRQREGELLFPARFPAEVVERDKRNMGSYAVAGQFQQTPVLRGGGMFKRDWFEIADAAPVGVQWVRAWDLAASEAKDAAFTAGCKMGRAPDGSYWIADMRRDRLSPGGVEKLLKATATQDGYNVRGSIPRDPGQAGVAQSMHLIKLLAGFPYRASPETGDKATRAQGLAAQAEVGNVKLIRGDWNEAFLDEITMFPVGKYADQVDAASRAFAELTMTNTTPLVGSYG